VRPTTLSNETEKKNLQPATNKQKKHTSS